KTYSSFVRATSGFKIAPDVVMQSVSDLLFVVPTENGDVLNVPALVIDSGNVKGAAAGHIGDGIVVHIRGVLDGIGAGADGVARTVGAVAMYGEALAILVRQVSRRFDFFVSVGLESGDVFVGTCGSIHLDHVHSGGHFFANHAHHLGQIVGSSARRRYVNSPGRPLRHVNSISCHEHPRPDHGAAIDQVAH